MPSSSPSPFERENMFVQSAQAALPDFLLRQRWYPAKDAGRPEVESVAIRPFLVPSTPAAVAVWKVTPPDRPAMLLFVPLAVVPAEAAAEEHVIAVLPPEADQSRRLVEAFSVDDFVRAWIETILRGNRAALEQGALRVGQTQALKNAGLAPGSGFAIRRSSAEQSNTSIRIGDGTILKVIRKLEVGVHPELEVGRFLTDEGRFGAAPAMLGWIEWAAIEGADSSALSVLQAFVPNDGDGWSWILKQLESPEGHTAVITWLRHLGQRTAEMHCAFAVNTNDPAFRAEPVGDADRNAWVTAAEAMARRALDRLAATRERLVPEAQQLADELLARRDVLEQRLRGELAEASGFTRIRHHGDYHLGQILVADGDAVIVDFEGEPLRPLAERRRKHAALRDVAGLLRSLAYAAAQAEKSHSSTLSRSWEAEASGAFLEGYYEAAAGRSFLPSDRGTADAVMRFFMLEKSLYEVVYELANRPNWVAIPLRGVVTLLDGDSRSTLQPLSHALGSFDEEFSTSSLDKLAKQMGIEPDYHDARGHVVRASAETKRNLLVAMGVEAADETATQSALDALERAEWNCVLPPVVVLNANAGSLAVEVTLPAEAGEIAWHLKLEEGGERSGRTHFAQLSLIEERNLDGRKLQRRRLSFVSAIPWGYHCLRIKPGDAETTLVVSPGHCWLPSSLMEGRRIWGIAAQLYLLRSMTNWGIGDFGDLRNLVKLAAAHGADVIGLNPLHAMFHDNPEHASPYSPASRLLLNILNIDVLAVPELLDCAEIRSLIASDSFRATLDTCRVKPLVDYGAITAIKLSLLRVLFEHCHNAPDRTRWEAFEAFRRERGDVLERHCLFLALREHFASRDPTQASWRGWPEAYRNPASPAVAAFAAENRLRIDFLAWLQWIADTQLAVAAATAAACDMAVGLYRDLAVGADHDGVETWANASAVVSGAQVGAPPDILNPAGQNWGLPPFHPRALRQESYRSFIDLVRANMRHAGGLRIDHVMGLQHLYWVPEGQKPTTGAYVAYPLADLVGILALESHRQRCLVVGEDLGTVPEGFRERMAAANILSYRVLFFEQDPQTGMFLPPEDYPSHAVAVLGSHDLPTLRGWWEERDIELKERLGLYPQPSETKGQHEMRQHEKAQFLATLAQQKLLTEDEEPNVPSLSQAAHAFLARTTSLLAMAQIDDLTDEADPVNIPATSDEHPNWRRRLSVTLEELGSQPHFINIAKIFRAERADQHERSSR
jgi:4-alpha-glucanotransferase